MEQLTIDVLTNLAMEVWASMADIQLTPAEPSQPASYPAPCVVSGVQIQGAWQGSVRLYMELPLVLQTTARMLMADASEISSDELRDAAGELANMTGGSFKALLPEPCSLSLPTVLHGVEPATEPGAEQPALQTWLTSEFGQVAVTVLEM